MLVFWAVYEGFTTMGDHLQYGHSMIVAEFKIVPVGTGSSMRSLVDRTTETLDKTGLRYRVGALGTTIEADSIEEILDAIAKVDHEVGKFAPRIQLDLSIDHRFDKEVTLSSLIAQYQKDEASAVA